MVPSLHGTAHLHGERRLQQGGISPPLVAGVRAPTPLRVVGRRVLPPKKPAHAIPEKASRVRRSLGEWAEHLESRRFRGVKVQHPAAAAGTQDTNPETLPPLIRRLSTRASDGVKIG
jgi:hypothetical protein